MAFFPAGEKLGPYELLAPIGAGGMGEVYQAYDSRLDRHVAIKVLGWHVLSDSTARERLRREAKAPHSGFARAHLFEQVLISFFQVV